MRRLVMGPERYSEVLASVGLQGSDIRAMPQSDTERRLWTALKRACDPDFVVNLPPEPKDVTP